MEQSILKTIKAMLNILPDDDSFDTEILIFINSAFSHLMSVGVGPDNGFAITDADTEWSTLLQGDKHKNMIKTYVFYYVKIPFDPPSTGYLVEALKELRKEEEFKLNMERELIEWVDPDLDHPRVLVEGG